jgi:type II secretory pathway pseudopilin PulG
MKMTRRNQSGAAQMIVLIVVAVLLGVGYVALDMYGEGQKYTTMTESRGMQIIQALSKHKLEAGAYPASLAALTPKFIAAVPACPAGEPFAYETAGGEFKLTCQKVAFKSKPYGYESRTKAWRG